MLYILTNVQKAKYGKLTVKVAEEIPLNKLCVYLIDNIDLKNHDVILKRERDNFNI